MDLSTIKSATRIIGQDLVAEKLIEVEESRQKFAGPAPHTTITLREDGRAFVSKRSPAVELSESYSADQVKQLATSVGLKWDDRYAERVIPVWSSDQRVDRPGDIVMQNWDFANYRMNPLALDSHDWDALPVGNAIQTEVRQRVDAEYSGPALHQAILFALEEEYARADTVYRMMKAGFLRTVSVGFFPGSVIYVENQDERAKLGLGRYGVIFDNNELVEISPTSVPAHPRAGTAALMSAKAKGLLRSSDGDVVRELTRKQVAATVRNSEEWRKIDDNLRHVWKNLFPDWKAKEHNDLGAPVGGASRSTDPTEDARIQRLTDELHALTLRVDELAERHADAEARSAATDVVLQPAISREDVDVYADVFKALDKAQAAAKSLIGQQ